MDLSRTEMSPALLWALGILALASIVQVVALAVASARLLRSWRTLELRGARMAADVAVVGKDLDEVLRGFGAAAAAGSAALERSREMAGVASQVGRVIAFAVQLGAPRAAALWGLRSLLRQRG